MHLTSPYSFSYDHVLKPDGLISGIKSQITGAINEVGNKVQSGIQSIAGKADKWTEDNLWR